MSAAAVRAPQARQRILVRSVSFVRLLLAFFLLSGYLLPQTVWGQHSAGTWLLNGLLRADLLPMVLATGIFVFGTLALYARGARSRSPRAPLLVLVGLYLSPFVVTGLLGTANPPLIVACVTVALSLSTGLLAAWLCGTTERATLLLCLVAAFQAVYTLAYQKMGINTLQSGDVLRAGGTFNHPNGVYILMLLTLPIVLSRVLARPSTVEVRSTPATPEEMPPHEAGDETKAASSSGETSTGETAVWMLMAALLFAALLLTWYRGAFLALAVGVLWMCARLGPGRTGKAAPVASPRRFRPIALLALGCLFALVCLFSFYYRVQGAANARSAAGSLSGRLLLWQQTWTVFCNNWVTGVGVGVLELPVPRPNAPPETRAAAQAALNGGSESIEHDKYLTTRREPNNLLLLWLAEMGVSGGILLILFVLSLKRMLAPAVRALHPIALGIAAAWLALLVVSLTDTPFGTAYRYPGNATVGALLGATLLLPIPSARRRTAPAVVAEEVKE